MTLMTRLMKPHETPMKGRSRVMRPHVFDSRDVSWSLMRPHEVASGLMERLMSRTNIRPNPPLSGEQQLYLLIRILETLVVL